VGDNSEHIRQSLEKRNENTVTPKPGAFEASAADVVAHFSHTTLRDAEGLEEVLRVLETFDADSVEGLVGGLVGYWGRERLADSTARVHQLHQPHQKLRDDEDVICDLTFSHFEKNGRSSQAIFTYPEQSVGADVIKSRGVFICDDENTSTASIYEVLPEEHRVAIRWSNARVEDDFLPTTLVLDDWVNPAPKPDVMASLATQLAAGGRVNEVTWDLLTRSGPRFIEDGGPGNGIFSDDVEDAKAWVAQLDNSYVAVQGPPGSGKTYLGSRLIRSLIDQGKRVGITAMSHSAVENLLEAVIAAPGESELRAVKKASKVPENAPEGLTYATVNAECANVYFNVVAGTTWLFASEAMLQSPVDVLVIDEAGQLSLADAVVASMAAGSVILLGDPQQLAQVAKAEHPGNSGASVLEYVLEGNAVIDESRGVFLGTTRRMHPEITSYISEHFYEGELGSHATCALQEVVGEGSGLRWLQASSTGRTTSSLEEALVIREEISRLLGKNWVTHEEKTKVLGVDDFMVVAPYNDQVDLIRETLDESELTKGVAVGTVDKFQGREAAVVFFSMTASTRKGLRRGPEFLFSKNRLNVAISRARALAYLVSTEDLLTEVQKDEDGALLAPALVFAALN
jgi:uncharacterized protein